MVKTYDGINLLIINVQHLDPTSVPLGVEPFLFGVFYLAYDLATVWLRNLVVFIIKKIISHKHEKDQMMM